MENKALVTVILPTHDHAPFIAQAIDSVLMQRTDFPFDILLHDDASTDGTADICRDYAQRYPDRIRLIAQTVNQYQTDRRIWSHILLPRVTAKYTAILEGDDYWLDPEKLAKQVGYLEAHPDCTMTAGGSEVVDVQGRPVDGVRPYAEDRIIRPEDMILGGGGFIATNTVVMPTALLRDPPDFVLKTEVEDAPFELLGALAGYAYYFADTLGAYRQAVPGSWTVRQYASATQTRIATSESIIALHMGFDAYTQGRYHEAFLEKNRYEEFQILCYKHELSALKRPPYRRFYEALSAKRKIRLHLEKYCPRLAARYMAWRRR